MNENINIRSSYEWIMQIKLPWFWNHWFSINDTLSLQKLMMFCKLLKKSRQDIKCIIHMFWSCSNPLCGTRSTPGTACWTRQAQLDRMCSTYPICSFVANDSNNGSGATNTSNYNVPGIFNLDVGDTNWVITSSFIIFTMQTGEIYLCGIVH